MSSSSEAPVAHPELRVGNWTRLGGSTVLGDQVTESMLDVLAERTRDAARAQGYATGWAGRDGDPSHGFQVTFFRSRTGLATECGASPLSS